MKGKNLTRMQLRVVASDVLELLENHAIKVPARDAVVVLCMCIAALCNMLAHKTGKSGEIGGRIACDMVMKLIKDWKDHKPQETA